MSYEIPTQFLNTAWRINIWLFEGLPDTLANICSFLPLFFLVNAGPYIPVKLDFMYEERLCVLALIGCERVAGVAQTHPLAYYFLV